MTQEHGDTPDIRHTEATRSYLVFKELIAEISEDSDQNMAGKARKVSEMIESGDIGIICTEGVRKQGLEERVVVTQVRLGDRNIPTFIVSCDLNGYETLKSFEGVFPLVNSGNARERVIKNVINAIDEMAFALEARERFGGV